MQKNQTIGIALIILLIGVGYFFTIGKIQYSNKSQNVVATSSSAATTTMDIDGSTVSVSGTGEYTVKEIPITNNALKAPDFNAPLVFSSSTNFTEEQKSALRAKAAGLRAQLAKDPLNYTAWLALGSTHKTAGDYAQAEKIWRYVSSQWPTDATVLGNLGDLYMNFIKDYPKADASYLGAIRNNPRQTNAYRSLFSLYSGVYTTHAYAAEDILKKGIKNNPEALDLYVLLARHYRDLGRTAEAKAEYDMAIVIAKGQTNAGAADILADITDEQADIK
ncbi:MAG: hypothetical protein UY44_C0002G0053 [Candidatus Kaiserbacteria bacterium GW2011_GWA2_49_19]|uniref:Uncharacterized protein n=2 Tax=Candidatus Kaiseribacteriota TaxID=1752734 RepID=A0A0G1VSB8_9BACT|nr:MAG: hypothetical protein UY44_C0002G0053 [Candidatus Kaiserbacteria bacterium GW2011_GWA2_49_19]OGG60508.1 MAG: hypothetical protein A3C86_01135 [Candidatus Kaiserbacteria bacterium RIFCSPHIGHO2_02_FULL_49_16]